MSQAENKGLKKMLLGEWLLLRGLVRRSQLAKALGYARLRKVRIGDALVELRLMARDQVEEEAEAREIFLAFTTG